MQQSPELRKALSAALHVGAALGLSGTTPHVLRHSNHTSVHLRPYPVVARVRLNIEDPQNRTRLLRELEICRHLNSGGAPAVAPVRDFDPGPHYHDDAGLTLWHFVEHRPATEADWPAAKLAYRKIHRAMVDYAGSLESFFEPITECRALLREQERLPGLPRAETDFLRATCDRLMAKLRGTHYSTMPVHGDPHLGNVLISSDGPIWADFESVCLGPLEWDLTCFPLARDEKWNIDLELLDLLRGLRSLCVVVWCSMGAERPPVQRQAAAWHLKRLRTFH